MSFSAQCNGVLHLHWLFACTRTTRRRSFRKLKPSERVRHGNDLKAIPTLRASSLQRAATHKPTCQNAAIFAGLLLLPRCSGNRTTYEHKETKIPSPPTYSTNLVDWQYVYCSTNSVSGMRPVRAGGTSIRSQARHLGRVEASLDQILKCLGNSQF